MQLDTLIVKNFQCFGPDGIALDMTDPVTTMIGANGSGKTAVFQALNRMFGLGGSARKIEKSDFHFSAAAANYSIPFRIGNQYRLTHENSEIGQMKLQNVVCKSLLASSLYEHM